MAAQRSAVQMTLGFSDGDRLYAVRYSSEHRSRTLFVSEDVESVRADLGFDGGDFRIAGVGLHHDDHAVLPSWSKSKTGNPLGPPVPSRIPLLLLLRSRAALGVYRKVEVDVRKPGLARGRCSHCVVAPARVAARTHGTSLARGATGHATLGVDAPPRGAARAT